jgi:glutamyl-tRNA synthetase
VDDIAMRVTHVIRGEDHLSNTSKHTELFKAFGAPLPVYAHIPLILKQNGPGKMSKRDQGALVEDYEKRGFIPEALVNFLCLLGWSPKDDREKLPIAEIIRLFDLPGINQSNARFDEKKLAHMNMAYLHEMEPGRCFTLAKAFLLARDFFPAGAPDEAYLREVIALCQPKVRAIEDLPGFIGYFFGEDYAVDPKAREKVFAKGDPKARLGELLAALPAADFGSDAALEAVVQGLAAQHAAGTGDYIHPARLALSGTPVGPSFYGLLRVLGRERVTKRIERFLSAA